MSLENISEDGRDLVRVESDGPAQGTALVPVEAVVPTVEALIEKAVEHGISVEGLEKLLAMHERMEAAAARKAFFEALSAFQADCPIIGKDRTATVTTQGGGSYTYSYAPLEDIMQAIVPVLRQHGLSVRFDARFEDQAQLVTCIVSHRDGHGEQSEFRAPINPAARGMNVTQQSASALTYGRRYALLNALGIVVGGEDDDGRGSSGPDSARRFVPRPAGRDSGDGAPHPATVGTGEGRGTPGVQPSGQGRPHAAASSSPPPSAPRPVARNVVRIPRPSREPQDSDGVPTSLSSSATSVAETPAAPEGDASLREQAQVQARMMADAEKAELRVQLIKGQQALLRTMSKYADYSDDDLWNRANEVVDQWCVMGFSKPLVELSREELRRAAVKMAETVRERTGTAA